MDTDFDVIVFGTGLTESITAAALSKAGFKVAHLDSNPYYGGDEASLTLDELVHWADERSSTRSSFLSAQAARFLSISHSSPDIPNARQYSLSLAPSVIPSTGPLISSLIASGVSRYGGYKLLERTAIYTSSCVLKNVPGSKEDVFKSKDLTLLDKRRLMRFLTFAAGDFQASSELQGHQTSPFLDFLRAKFSLKDEIAEAITYALAFCVTVSDPTLPALHRIGRYLRSSGRYGTSPFLVGHYGGSGEIAQGFCRVSAVHGGVYILGRNTLSITPVGKPSEQSSELSSQTSVSKNAFSHIVELEDLEDRLTCSLIISSPDYIPPTLRSNAQISEREQEFYPIARCIAIFDGPIFFPVPPSQGSQPTNVDSGETTSNQNEKLPQETSNVDTAMLVFPPGSLTEGSSTTAVNALLTGEGSMSAPAGKCVLYLSMPLRDTDDSSPEALLKPYLHATLSSIQQSPSDSAQIEPLFSLFYVQRPSEIPPPEGQTSSSEGSENILITPACSFVLPESVDSATQNAESLFREAVRVIKSLGRMNRDDGTAQETGGQAESFWPALDTNDDEQGDTW